VANSNGESSREAVVHQPSALKDILENRRWARCRLPFPHVSALSVFEESFYVALSTQCRAILDSSRPRERASGYDADIVLLGSDTPYPMNIFLSRPWHDLLEKVLDLKASGDISVAMHRHPSGSRSGWVHNDLTPGWFVDRHQRNGLNNSCDSGCNYKTGETLVESGQPRQMVRAATLIFYLNNNERWTYGEGGETGLYGSASDPVERPDKRVPPLNNSLLLFECTPFSFHSFLNSSRGRTSLVMWLHRSKLEVADLWGKQAIVPWRR
jgi:hypothetical protein